MQQYIRFCATRISEWGLVGATVLGVISRSARRMKNGSTRNIFHRIFLAFREVHSKQVALFGSAGRSAAGSYRERDCAGDWRCAGGRKPGLEVGDVRKCPRMSDFSKV